MKPELSDGVMAQVAATLPDGILLGCVTLYEGVLHYTNVTLCEPCHRKLAQDQTRAQLLPDMSESINEGDGLLVLARHKEHARPNAAILSSLASHTAGHTPQPDGKPDHELESDLEGECIGQR